MNGCTSLKRNSSPCHAINDKRKAVVAGDHQPADDECDVPLIHGLADTELQKLEKRSSSFSLLFHFAENPHFTNSVLTKYYELKISPDNEDPFEGGQEEAKEGAGAGRFITKTVSNDSFFNFFEPTLKELTEDMDPESQESLRTDFETGQIVRDQIIPRAVLFFTGEGVEDDFDDFEDEDEDGEDGSDGPSDDDKDEEE
uniref:Uncharacterized protein n=1 Tax=Ditylenchus dipsaci TaxID=166011 RepID=A0A915ED15_9BILA